MRSTTQILRDTPGHALIAIHPLAHGCREISLIADPLHFPPDCVRRITATIAELLRTRTVEASESKGPWKQPPVLPDFDPAGDRFSSVQSAGRNQRILVSLIMQSGKVRAELAFTNTDPAIFPPEQIDWLIARLNDLLNEKLLARKPFVSGRN